MTAPKLKEVAIASQSASIKLYRKDIGPDGSVQLSVRLVGYGFSGRHPSVWVSREDLRSFLTDLRSLERSRRGEARLSSITQEQTRLRRGSPQAGSWQPSQDRQARPHRDMGSSRRSSTSCSTARERRNSRAPVSANSMISATRASTLWETSGSHRSSLSASCWTIGDMSLGYSGTFMASRTPKAGGGRACGLRRSALRQGLPV
jgi:hypothetical protein